MEAFDCPHCRKPIDILQIPELQEVELAFRDELDAARKSFDQALGVVNGDDRERLAKSADRLSQFADIVEMDDFSQKALLAELLICTERATKCMTQKTRNDFREAMLKVLGINK